MTKAPVIVWFRRDLRMADHPALWAATESGRPVLPVFIHDESVEALGSAAKWRLGEGLRAFAVALEAAGSRLILRRGPAATVLLALATETRAAAIHWTRGYDPGAIALGKAVKAAFDGIETTVRSFPGSTLFEPWQIETNAGGPYKVFTPFWRAVRGRDVGAPVPVPRLAAPMAWPSSDRLGDWSMEAGMGRGAAVVTRHASVGERAARTRLDTFLAERLADYPEGRNYPAKAATSGLSENLAWGEISPRMVWLAGHRERQAGQAGAEKFLSELCWRDYACHLMYHAPDLDRVNWRAGWNAFPWQPDNPAAEKWRRGLTGEPFVDAAMREMYVTGRMHNRARMIAASYLTKHLLTDWRVGLRWFAECLTDWDPAANAMGWQWVAGSGPDAAPFFRIFNPARQADKFDGAGCYRASFIAEGQSSAPETALAYFDAVPQRWGLSPSASYPAPVVDLKFGRERALEAYRTMKTSPR